MKRPDDIIPVPPTLSGPAGRAWRVDLALLRSKGTQPADAGVAIWVVEAPGAHPLWHSYLMTLIHLRPIAGTPEPLIYDPRATHELVVHALDPEEPRWPQMQGESSWRWLVPANFAAQLLDHTDVTADAAIEAAASLIVAGDLNPDTDATAQWRALFGDNMIKPEWR